ncbi:MAG: DNA polymerase III subunit delta, partial [Bacteroidales bacterium]|nr:DNA polymerase III subunit delta [Bacteroidales bacterium]
ITGHHAIKQRLVRTVKENRVSHAQLFLGPPGSGKLQMALAYAQFINCKNKTDGDSCGQCSSCVKYEKLAHPDLHFIFPTASVKGIEKPVSKNFIKEWRALLLERNALIGLQDWYKQIGIERKQGIINARDCSEIIQTLNYKSYEAPYKVMIIWMVEKLFHAAAPRILKILEEPPERTLFILISENQEQIINTILSRTQIVKVSPLRDEELAEKLKSEGYDPVLVHDVVKVAEGNYLEAKRMIAQTDEAAFHFTSFRDWMRLCWGGRFEQILPFVNDFSQYSRDIQKDMLIYSIRMIRESFLMNLGQTSLLRMSKQESEFAGNFNRFIHTGNIKPITEELNKTIYHIERNGNFNVVFLDASIKIARLLHK